MLFRSDAGHAEVVAGVDVETIGREKQRFHRHFDTLPVVRRKDEIAALLDQRLRQRLDEGALRERDFDIRALAFVAGLVARHQRHADARAGPGMVGQVGGRFGLAETAGPRREAERHLRRFDERAAGDELAADDGLGAVPPCAGV